MSTKTNAQSQTNTNHNEISDNDALIAIYGGKSFLKIYQALEIGKIKFCFVPKDEPKNSIDCYMNADDFASDFIAMIDSGELRKLAYNARVEQQKTGAQYASDVWESRVGVSTSGDTEQLRKFTIQPGNAQEFMFRASQGKKSVTIGFGWRELKLLSYRWHFLEADWNEMMKAKYNIKAMENAYHSKHNAEQLAQQEAEESMGDLPIDLPVPETPHHAEAPKQEPVKETPAVEEAPDYGITTSMKAEDIPVEDNLPVNNPIKEESPSAKEKPAANPVPEAKGIEAPKAETVKETEKKMCSLKVKTTLLPMKNGGKAFQGWNERNEVVSVVIRPDRLEKADAEIKRIIEEAGKIGNKITFEVGEERPDRIYVA